KTMIRILLTSLLVFSSFACGKKEPVADSELIGTWRGSVLIVDVEFIFTKDSYQQRTFSFNNVMIGGTKGSMTVEGPVIRVHQTQEYRYDNDTRKGAWFDKEANYTISYKISGNNISLHPSTSSETMELSKEQ
ncbi:MAG TPA: hypothetical protein PKJ30_18450, partial [Leptospiraceae bacterium]|nr:hypothetical protein [Leptospiraceae bacterium]